MKTFRWLLIGQVQGVGFRPFIYRLAMMFQLSGWVKNQLGQVEIVAQGNLEFLEKFSHDLLNKAPPLAKPKILLFESIELKPLNEFQILSSERTENAIIHVPPDYAPCQDCLAEFSDPSERRYQYPFINCTQCGPRFTIIESLPYDRQNTSMFNFPLCPDCQAEYENPNDRRFHAEPIACPICGPWFEFYSVQNTQYLPKLKGLKACVEALRVGEIVAVKGVGGYHLMCDACNDEAIKQLRKLKPRPHKPLAVLCPDDDTHELSNLKPFVTLEKHHIQFLRDPMRPIVMVNQSKNSPLSYQIAPGLADVGVMLPCSPLHVLLINTFGNPLVATSANVSGEPILTEAVEVEKRLGLMTKKCLHHNRPIVRPADDPVFRFIQGSPRPFRLGRGCTPKELTLPFELAQPTLAVGGHKKNTIALGFQNRVVISAHIGDLGSPRSQAVFEQVINDLQCLYNVQAKRVVCDAHSQYNSSRWAAKSGLPLYKVYHHHAHAAAVMGEFYSFQKESQYTLKSSPKKKTITGNRLESWLIFTWDGVGLGEDGTLWGGEAFYGQPGQWQRVGTIRSFAPPGADKAGREPWRSALAVCWETGHHWAEAEKIVTDYDLLQQAWKRQLNCPRTSAVGRLFDAAAALTGLVQKASFEGQGPMMLESVVSYQLSLSNNPIHENPITNDSLSIKKYLKIDLPIHTNSDDVKEIDWEPLIPMLLDTHESVPSKAACFHASLAHSLRDLACLIREEYGVTQIGLSGGVFQNRVLCESVFSLLHASNFNVFLGEQLPANDAALSFGQMIEMSLRDYLNF
ncbi:carbamoyltransferase HypF [Candidatus Parabeggiatoa sp. HSG14]|uniref:carbamoyltransferase HypF n=1 Tax=Candidatus Parabeggiatoa sp. HSG14 TaxID=3055593 RepID=UPI0025A734CA|nr:carbamoyltransferase HypF [Thiotrichales bacterium HSG14]